MFQMPDVADVIARSLAEDLGLPVSTFLPGAPVSPTVLERDVTTHSTIEEASHFSGVVVARTPGVVCGLPVLAAVYERLSMVCGLTIPVEVFPLVAEGAHVEPGTAVAEVEGPARAVLSGERSALDLLMVLSGIATRTAEWVEAVHGELEVYDTRKTLPGLRELSKYAVRVGGGENHRMGLFDMALVKDNHLKSASGVTAAIGRIRLRHPSVEVEVEADTVEQAVEAVASGADVVLLDNMEDSALEHVVRVCREGAERRGRAVILEVSGNVTIDRLPEIAAAGIDRVSASALTLAPPIDFGLDEL